MDIYGYIYIWIPGTRSARSCQVPDRARYLIEPKKQTNIQTRKMYIDTYKRQNTMTQRT